MTKNNLKHQLHQIRRILLKNWSITVVLLVVLLLLSLGWLSRKAHQPAQLPTLQKTVFGSWEYQAKIPQAQMSAAFANTKTGAQVQVERDKTRIEFNLPLTAAKLNQDSNQLTYQTSNGNQLKYQLTTNGIKEEIILPQAPESNDITTNLKVTNATIKQSTGGLLLFFNKDNNQYQYHFEKPFATDAAGKTTHQMSYKLIPKENQKMITPVLGSQITLDKLMPYETHASKQLLTAPQPILAATDQFELVMEIDPKWLFSPERQFPITVDPTVVHDTSAEFTAGQLNHVKDLGSGSSPKLETWFQPLAADAYTVGLWHLDETSDNTCSGGQDACDSSGNGLHATSSNSSIDTTNQLLGTADRSHNGSTSVLTVAGSAKLDLQAFTIEAWVYANDYTQNGGIFEKTASDTVNTQYSLFFNSGDLIYFRTYDTTPTGDNLTASFVDAGVKDNQWTHVAATYDGTTKKIFVNGKEVASKAYSVTLNTGSTGDATIGSLYGAYRWNGLIDEVRVSNTARTPQEIWADSQRRSYGVYTSESLDLTSGNTTVTSLDSLQWSANGLTTGDGETATGSAASSIVAQWNFNETSGTTANNDAEGTSCGGTPANCDATLTNFAYTASQDATSSSGWTANNKRWGAGALMFEGINDYATVTQNSAINFNQSDAFSIETWVKINRDDTENYIVNKQENVTNEFLFQLRTTTTGLPTFIVGKQGVGANAATGNGKLALGEWYHLVGVSDGSKIYLYVNGVLQATTSITVTASTQSVANLLFGRFYNSTVWCNATVDVTRIYNRALTANEVMANYNSSQIEFMTRTSADNSTWEAWRPVTNETSLDTFDNPSAWSTPSATTWPSVPLATVSSSVVKMEGGGAMQMKVGAPKVDMNTLALYHFDETNGDNAGVDIFDETNNNNDGEIYGTNLATAVVEGMSGKARNFNGSDDYVDIGAMDSMESLSALSIETWVFRKGGTANYDGIFTKYNATTNSIDFLTAGASGGVNDLFARISTGAADAYGYSTGNLLTANEWHHVAMVFDGSQSTNATRLKIYIDGAAQTLTFSGTIPATTPVNASNANIGRYNDAAPNYFNGIIDELKISNTARSASEIAEAYRAGRNHNLTKTISSTDLSGKNKLAFYVASDQPGTNMNFQVGETTHSINQIDANTLAYWNFEDNNGTGAFIKDVSGNGYNGTPTGVTYSTGKVGRAAVFDSADDISLGNVSLVDNAANLTVEAWLNPTAQAATYYRLFGENNVLLVGQYGSQIAFFMGSGVGWLNSSNTMGALPINTWSHVVWVKSGTTAYVYLNGQQISTMPAPTTLGTSSNVNYLSTYDGTTQPWAGMMDEVRISNVVRTADEIRQSYEAGLRTHPITIDFKASLDNTNLIDSSDDLSFTILATSSGLPNNGSNLYIGDKIIVRETLSGTEYIAQGSVTTVNSSTGAVTISAWDTGSTFPTTGYTKNATVFKWQREYFDLNNILASHDNAITQLVISPTDTNKGYSAYFDDLKSNTNYLATPTGSSITSTPNRYLQYQAIMSTIDASVSAQLTNVTLTYTQNTRPSTPSLDSPSDTATNQKILVPLKTTTTDIDSDYLRYKIQLCENLAMTTNCQTFDQTSSQTGWTGQNTQSNTAYTSGTQATYTIQTALTENTTYYWRSYAIDPGGSALWTETQGTPYSFTTSYIPETPTLDSPASASAVTTTTPTLRTASTDNNSDYLRYKIQLCTNYQMTTGCQTFDQTSSQTGWTEQNTQSYTAYNSGSQASYTIQTPLTPLNYYWRSYAIDPGGSNTWSGTQTAPFSFFLNQVPTDPSGLLAEGTTNPSQVTDTTPEFSAVYNDPDTSDTATYYQIQVASNGNFASGNTVWDSGQTAMTPINQGARSSDIAYAGSTLHDGTTYYWRIKFWDAGGNYSPWSEAYFTMDSLLYPSYITLEKNAANTQIIINWTDTNDNEDNYVLEKSVDGAAFTAFSTEAADTITKTDTSVSSGHTYQYRIKSTQTSGSSSPWGMSATLSLQSGSFKFEGLGLEGLKID